MKSPRTKRTKLDKSTFVRADKTLRTKPPKGGFCPIGPGPCPLPVRTKLNSVQKDPVVTFADHVLRGITDTPQLAIGPLVWGINQGADTRHWYFVVGSAGPQDNLRLDSFKVAFDDRGFAEQCRAALFAELVTRPKPSVVVDFDDELAMAHWCEAVCPGERSARIRANIERERAHDA